MTTGHAAGSVSRVCCLIGGPQAEATPVTIRAAILRWDGGIT